MLAGLAEHCVATDTHLVLGGDPFFFSHEVAAKSRITIMEAFDAVDYSHIGRALLGQARSASINFAKGFQFARRLVARQLAQTFEALKDLKGIDDVIAALEAHILIPLEQVELASELDLKPKRGVLLAGPPGTGKTTIGRALARRRGKFFLIDGTLKTVRANRERYAEADARARANRPTRPSFFDVADMGFAHAIVADGIMAQA